MAKTTQGVKKAPAPQSQNRDHQRDVHTQPKNFSQVTIGLAISMAWQLVVVVLVPVLAGHAIDNKFDQSPRWTTVGVIIATIGMIMVVRRTVQEMNSFMAKYMEENKLDK